MSPAGRTPRRVRLEPARRDLFAALADVGTNHGLSRGDEIELLTMLLAERVARWRQRHA